MQQNVTLTATKWLDELKFNRLHVMFVLMVYLTLIFDGYAALVLGYLIPSIMKEWHLTPLAAGALASYTFAGLMLGSLTFGTLADFIGRKKAMLLGILTCSIFSGFSYWVPDFRTLCIMRFVAGLGIGGTLPVSGAFISEYVPARVRARALMTAFTGINSGAIVAAICSMTILPHFGWRSPFLFEFLIFLLIPFMIAYMPESIRFLSQKQRYERATRELRRLERIAGIAPLNWTAESFALPAEAKVGLKQLFSSRYAVMTILIWFAHIFNMINFFGMGTWLPALFVKQGYSGTRSISYAMVTMIGAIVGAILLGRIMDRFGRKPGLVTNFILGGIATCLFSLVHSNTEIYLVAAFWGLTGGSTMMGLVVVAGETYPTQFRAGAVAWSNTVGRSGAIIAGLLGGWLQMGGFTFNQFFYIFALPCFINAVLVLLFRVNVRGDSVETVTGKLAGRISAAGA